MTAAPPSAGAATASTTGAARVGAVTAAARGVGLLRTVVAGRVLGTTRLGDAYVAANTVPTVAYELVAGGALAATVVPLLAPAVEQGDRRAVDRTASALLTWSVGGLVVVALVGAALTHPVVDLLLADGTDRQRSTAARMLLLFWPQMPLYGVNVVAAGVLQAHRRFTAPALAPLLSSVVVTLSYLLYAAVAGPDRGVLERTSRGEELLLALGTTAGVVALSLPLLLPVHRLGVRLRPTRTFPPGVGPLAVRLGAGGVAALAAQQLVALLVLALAVRTTGGGVQLWLAQTVYLVPWAVLLVPVATTVYPNLSAGDRSVLPPARRRVLLLGSAGAVALLLVAWPVASLLLTVGGSSSSGVEGLRYALLAWALGLPAFGLLALEQRALLARRAWREATAGVAGAWVLVAVADLLLVRLLPTDRTVAALGLGNAIGMTAGAVWLRLRDREPTGRPADRPALPVDVPPVDVPPGDAPAGPVAGAVP